MSISSDKLNNFWLPLLINLTYIIIIISHLWQLDTVPRGFYTDELATGYNAITIADTGKDEFGHFLPLYFQSFGDYKQPIFVYTTALVFKLLGASEFNLRLVSFLYFMLFIVSLHLIVKQLFPRSSLVLLYALITAGFLPWYFTLSRIAFDAITQLGITALALFFVLKTYHDPPTKQRISNPVLAGSLLGLSIYSYTTSRLLAFLYLLITLLIYARRSTLKRSIVFTIYFLVVATPFIAYSWQYPGRLNAYVHQMVYIDDPTPLTDRLNTFTKYYFSYFNPSYLLSSGDTGNLRHHSGYGGQLFITTVILAIIGALNVFFQPSPHRRFSAYLAICLVLTPIAAAITIPYLSPHALRSSLLGLFLLLLSCWGFHSTINFIHKRNFRLVASSLIFLALITQAYLYTRHYFTVYPDQSIKAFETYDFKADITKALALKPDQIIISSLSANPHIFYDFYKHIIPNRNNIPVKVSPPTSIPHTCVIYFVHFAAPPKTESLPFRDYSPPLNDTQLRCYQ